MDRRASPSMKVSDAGFRQVALLSRCGVRTCRVLHSPMPCVPNCSSSPRCRAIDCASSRIRHRPELYTNVQSGRISSTAFQRFGSIEGWTYGGCVDETTASLGAYEAAPRANRTPPSHPGSVAGPGIRSPPAMVAEHQMSFLAAYPVAWEDFLPYALDCIEPCGFSG